MSEENHKLEAIDFIYGELDAAGVRSLRKQASVDSDLAEDLRSLGAVRSLYAEIELPDPSPLLSQAILRQETILRAEPASFWQPLTRWLTHPVFGLATVLLIAGGAGFFHHLSSTPQATGSFAQPSVEGAAGVASVERPHGELAQGGGETIREKSPQKLALEPEAVVSKGIVDSPAYGLRDKKDRASRAEPAKEKKPVPNRARPKANRKKAQEAAPYVTGDQDGFLQATGGRSSDARFGKLEEGASGRGAKTAEVQGEDTVGFSDDSELALSPIYRTDPFGSAGQVAAQQPSAPRAGSAGNSAAFQNAEPTAAEPPPSQESTVVASAAKPQAKAKNKTRAAKKGKRIPFPKRAGPQNKTEEEIFQLQKQRYSNKALSHFEAGMVAFDSRQYLEALGEFDRAIQLDRSRRLAPGPRVMQARCLVSLKRYRQAAKLYEEVLAKNPDYEPAERAKVVRELVACYRITKQDTLAKKAIQRYGGVPAKAAEKKAAPAATTR